MGNFPLPWGDDKNMGGGGLGGGGGLLGSYE